MKPKYVKINGIEFLAPRPRISDTAVLITASLLCVIGAAVSLRTNRINAELSHQLDLAEAPQQVTIEIPLEKKAPESFEQGIASYYSREGCMGCDPERIMANGKPLDDTKQTVAYNKASLGSHIAITNLKNNRRVIAEVTDRGGYEKSGKVIDLSVATRDALGCGSTCPVKVERISQ